MSGSDAEELIRLSQIMFEAEDKGGSEGCGILDPILAEGAGEAAFHIVRAAIRGENKATTLGKVWMAKASRRKREVSDASAQQYDNVAVITCLVTLREEKRESDSKRWEPVGRYWNTQAFAREAGGAWRCCAWQVAPL